MWSMKDMFYGNSEPIWILNHAKNDNEAEEENEENKAGEENESSREEPEREEYSTQSGSNEEQEQSPLATGPYYLYQSPYSSYPYRPAPYYYGHVPANSDESPRREKKVVMKIPICCGECEESIRIPLLEMRGVKHVRCDILKERVTVITTAAAAPADILLACRKVFKESRMWSDDD